MQRAALGLVVLAGCAAEPTPRPELHFDVQLHRWDDLDSVWVQVTEPDRPDATADQVPFAHPGECDVTSDGWVCNGACPGEWVDALLLVQNGAVIDEAVFDSPYGNGFVVQGADLGGASLVITDVDGREVEVPLPVVNRPVPTIDDVTRTPVGINLERFDIAWSTTPPGTSAVVSMGSGFGGPRCHDEGASGVTAHQFSTGGTLLEAYVTAYAEPEEFANAMGTVHVWAGAGTSLDLSGT